MRAPPPRRGCGTGRGNRLDGRQTRRFHCPTQEVVLYSVADLHPTTQIKEAKINYSYLIRFKNIIQKISTHYAYTLMLGDYTRAGTKLLRQSFLVIT